MAPVYEPAGWTSADALAALTEAVPVRVETCDSKQSDDPADGFIAYVLCYPDDPITTFWLNAYRDLPTAQAAYQEFLDDPDCTGRSLDGDLLIAGQRVGSAGGCSKGTIFLWTVEAQAIVGAVNADTYGQARAYFDDERLGVPADGAITGKAFGPVPTPKPTPRPKPTPTPPPLTYDDIVRDNADHQGEEVRFTGDVEQYTEDPAAPFTVLVHVGGKTSIGIYTLDPIGLTEYPGKPLIPGDTVTFVGTVGPLVTYDSVFGSRTIPTVSVTGLTVRP